MSLAFAKLSAEFFDFSGAFAIFRVIRPVVILVCAEPRRASWAFLNAYN